jgi:hypothetical protein
MPESFSRGFLVTFGVLAAIAVSLLSCAGILSVFILFTSKEESSKTPAVIDTLTIDARQIALPHLKEHGIATIDDDAKAVGRGEYVSLHGTGLGEDGKLHTFSVLWIVGDFKTKKRWQLESIAVDDEMVFVKGVTASPSP